MPLDDLSVLVSQVLTLYWLQKKYVWIPVLSSCLRLSGGPHLSATCNSLLLFLIPLLLLLRLCLFKWSLGSLVFFSRKNSGPLLRVKSSNAQAGTVRTLGSVKPVKCMGKREGTGERNMRGACYDGAVFLCPVLIIYRQTQNSLLLIDKSSLLATDSYRWVSQLTGYKIRQRSGCRPIKEKEIMIFAHPL